MKSLKMLTMLLFAGAMGALLLCTNKPTESNNNPDTHKGLYGKLVDTDGKAVSGVTVKALAATGGLLMKHSPSSTSGTDNDANVSTVYSKAFTLNAPSPTKVRTFITWKFLNTLGTSVTREVFQLVRQRILSLSRRRPRLFFMEKSYLRTTISGLEENRSTV